MGTLSKKTAINLGLSFYNTGKKCKNGHYSSRYVSSSGCVSCIEGPPKQPKPKVSGARVHFACTSEMKKQIKEYAVMFDMTVSEYLRYLVENY